MFQVRTAQSRQKLNVYKQVKQVQSRVSIDIIRYAPYVILFEQRHQFLHCCKINQTVWERIESLIGGWQETLNLLHATGCKIFSIFVMSDMEQNRKSQLNYQEYAVRTGNHLYSGNCSTAGHGVFTISCPEAVGKTLQFNLYLKHCNSQKKQNTSISVVIVPFRRVNKNSVAQDGLAQIYWVAWLNFRETIRLPDTEYLRFCVRKLLENNAMNGRNKTLVFRW